MSVIDASSLHTNEFRTIVQEEDEERVSKVIDDEVRHVIRDRFKIDPRQSPTFAMCKTLPKRRDFEPDA